MAAKLIDLTGQRFGRLLVVSRAESARRARWNCQCDCGQQKSVSSSNLRCGLATSCGCYREELRNSPKRPGLYVRDYAAEYMAWKNAIRRCEDPTIRYYSDYGGRGIFVCKRWRDDFSAFVADMGRRPSAQHTLDRVDNDGPYAPANCRWATPSQQNLNRRNTRWLVIEGERIPLVHAAERFGLPARRIYSRLRRGWSDADAVRP